MRLLVDAVTTLFIGAPYSLWENEVSDDQVAWFGLLLAGAFAAFAMIFLIGARL